MPAASNAQGQPKTETMDHLVKEIAENLKLSGHHASDLSVGGHRPSAASFKLKSSFRRGHGAHRSSPYAVPPSSRACDTNLGSSPTSRGPSQLRKWNHQRRRYPSTCMNTNQGSVGVTGAVNVGERGKKNDDPGHVDPEDDPFEMLQELITGGDLIKEAVRRLQKGLYTSPTVKTFYDSEDDEGGRTPPNLCCEVGL